MDGDQWKSVVCLILASTEAMANKDERSKVADTIAYELLGQIKQTLKILAGSPFQLGHLNATTVFGLSIAIPPFGVSELWRPYNDFGKGEARRGVQSLHMNMNASVESKD